MRQKFVCLAIAAISLAAPTVFGHTALPDTDTIYAQKLVDEVVKKNPDMLDVLFHVSRSAQEKNTVIAAHLSKDLGEVSGDDDLGVMNTGKPLVEVQKDGVRIGVLVQLRDQKGNAIGALGLMYPYHTGQNQAKVLARSNAIRDMLAKEIKNVQELTRKD